MTDEEAEDLAFDLILDRVNDIECPDVLDCADSWGYDPISDEDARRVIELMCQADIEVTFRPSGRVMKLFRR